MDSPCGPGDKPVSGHRRYLVCSQGTRQAYFGAYTWSLGDVAEIGAIPDWRDPSNQHDAQAEMGMVNRAMV